MISGIASLGEWPHGVARLGVLLSVSVGIVVAGLGLSDSLHGSAHWASKNSSLSYFARSVPTEEAIGSKKVAEDARLWMPANASYRIVTGADVTGPLQWAAPDFLQGFLLPRRQTDSTDAEWVLCLRCDTQTLGARFDVLSDGGDGILFGRLRP